MLRGRNISCGKAGLIPSLKIFADLDDFSSDIKITPEQIDACRLALEKEQEMIDVCQELLEGAKTEQDRQLFTFLAEQKQMHYKMFKAGEIEVEDYELAGVES